MLAGLQGSGTRLLKQYVMEASGLFLGWERRDSKGNKWTNCEGWEVFGSFQKKWSPWDGTAPLTVTHSFANELERWSVKSRLISQREGMRLREVVDSYGYKGVLLVRNPWDAALSFWKHRQVGVYRSPRNYSTFESKGIFPHIPPSPTKLNDI